VTDTIKLILALTLISLIAGFAIGKANYRTKDRIAAKQQAARQGAIDAVFPEGFKIKEMNDDGGILPQKYWIAFSDDKLSGYAFEMAGSGYAGDIRFMVGVGLDGKILGLTVLEHHETPGLGSRVNEVASTKYIWFPFGGDDKTKPWFTEQFEGISTLRPIGVEKSAGEWHRLSEQARAGLRDRNAVSAITGSTITTAAFTRAIERSVSKYLEELGGYCCPATRKKREAEAGAAAGENGEETEGGDDS
jgi:electron transport complex protein RnfG